MIDRNIDSLLGELCRTVWDAQESDRLKDWMQASFALLALGEQIRSQISKLGGEDLVQ